MIIDTHTHLYLDDFAPDNDEAVKRAIDAGVGMMIFPNVDLSTVTPLKQLAGRFPDHIRTALGLHPTEISENWRTDLAATVDLIRSHSKEIVAVGEIGIDLYWDKTFAAEQAEAFRTQASLAAELGLPVIIHCREALKEILEQFDLMETLPAGVFHSFGGTPDDVEAIRRRGDFYFGINGVVTFKNSRLADTLPAIGIDRILLETDSPYLTPVPFRGRRNESAYIVHVADAVSKALGLPRERVEAITTENARKLFNL